MMPLPLDLASVAWLAALVDYRHHWRAWTPLHYLAGNQKLDPAGRRLLSDLRIVVKDQHRYIRSLEEQLAPYLVRPTAEQGVLA
jgi:hypothetical protein